MSPKTPAPARPAAPALDAIPEAVLWEEGMLLSPQHFQQTARRHEDLLHYHARLASPFHRGVVEVVWDEGQLGTRLLRVSRLEAVMPDGLAVRHRGVRTVSVVMPDGDVTRQPREEPLELDLTPHETGARIKPVRIWLTVPAHRGANEPWTEALHRTIPTDGDRAVDEHTGQDIVVNRARPALRLVAGTPPGDAYVALPVAELEFVDESFRPTRYVPPLLRCSETTAPFRLCSRLAGDARNRANDLSQRAGAPEEILRALRALAAALPPFEAVLGTRCAHPFVLYHAFCTFAGGLAGALPAPVPPVFPPYDHDNLAVCFDAVGKFVGETLERVARTRQSQRFSAFGTGFRLAALEPEWERPDGLLVGLTAGDGMAEADVVAWMTGCTIASEGKLEGFRFNRVLGAARGRHTDSARSGVTPGRGEVLFRVARDPEFVDVGKPLVIFYPHDAAGRLRPAAASLYTPEPRHA